MKYVPKPVLELSPVIPPLVIPFEIFLESCLTSCLSLSPVISMQQASRRYYMTACYLAYSNQSHWLSLPVTEDIWGRVVTGSVWYSPMLKHEKTLAPVHVRGSGITILSYLSPTQFCNVLCVVPQKVSAGVRQSHTLKNSSMHLSSSFSFFSSPAPTCVHWSQFSLLHMHSCIPESALAKRILPM